VREPPDYSGQYQNRTAQGRGGSRFHSDDASSGGLVLLVDSVIGATQQYRVD